MKLSSTKPSLPDWWTNSGSAVVVSVYAHLMHAVIVLALKNTLLVTLFNLHPELPLGFHMLIGFVFLR